MGKREKNKKLMCSRESGRGEKERKREKGGIEEKYWKEEKREGKLS